MQFGEGVDSTYAGHRHTSMTTADGNEMAFQVLNDFLTKAGGITALPDIFDAVDHVTPFLTYPVTYDLPKVTKYKSKEAIESHYEDFLAF
jgi:hypothetical protein